MGGDYSRLRFDPKRDISAILMQQGRVQLDSDWNQFVDMLDRRWRAETSDIVGKHVVPRETPNGFQIQLAGTTLTIGRGRIYVDGLLAENHGLLAGDEDKPALEFDPELAEERGTLVAIPYDKQPYLPNAADVAPAPEEGGPHLVYLDVWRREVTFLEDSNLIEKAVGIDTITQSQTVWQVKVLPNVGAGAQCDTQVQAWSALIAPSDGRLSAKAVGVSTATDPCLLPPSGDYRGLDNRLYRVELHDGGSQGTATFKWSRDNASVATSVTAITVLDKITVSTLGRDKVSRFKPGNWVEIIDDVLELSRKPGVMAQIQKVESETQVITLTAPLPAGVFKTDARGNIDAKHHIRLRRWDQSGQVRDTNGNLLADLNAADSKGVIAVPVTGTSVVLEDGVQITFDTIAAGKYHVADYWTFAARTVDASVEPLNQAPSHGIHHHFCRLALVTFPGPPTDCRVFWPPAAAGEGCDCTICVSVESHNKKILTIQQAITKVVTAGGGTVCLGPGTYELGEAPNPIIINGAQSLRLRGHGVNTNLVYKGLGPTLAIDRSAAITVEELMITTLRGNDPSPVVAVTNSTSVTLQRNVVVQLGDAKFATPAIGLGGILIGTDIRENALFAPVGVGNILVAAPAGIVLPPQPVFVATLSLHVERNAMFNSRSGISLVGMSLHMLETRLAENFIRDCPEGGIVTLGFVVPGFGMDVRSNEILAKGSGSGIVMGVSRAHISGNSVSPVEPDTGGSGIVLTAGLDGTGLDECQVLENRIFGLGGDGIAINGVINSAMIKNNIIQSVDGGGIVMDDKSRAKNLSIENNQLLEITPKEKANDKKKAVAAIRVVNAAQVAVGANTIVGVGRQAFQNPIRAGIQLIACSSVRVAGNEIADIGPAEGFMNLAAGVECVGTLDHLDVGDNNIRRNQIPRNDPDDSKWFAIRILGGQSPPSLVAGAGKWVFGVKNKVSYLFLLNKIIFQPLGRELVDLKGNYMDVYGTVPAVEVQVSGACTLNHNRALLKGRAQPVADVQAGAAIAMANDLRAKEIVASLSLKLPAPGNAPFTALGNITTGPITVQLGSATPASLSPPWSALNIVAIIAP